MRQKNMNVILSLGMKVKFVPVATTSLSSSTHITEVVFTASQCSIVESPTSTLYVPRSDVESVTSRVHAKMQESNEALDYGWSIEKSIRQVIESHQVSIV